jgi:uncharacterized membrane protein YccC
MITITFSMEETYFGARAHGSKGARGENGHMIRGLAVRLSLPDVGVVVRSLLGVLLVSAVALEWGSVGTAVAAGGSAAIAGATAFQDSPRGRVRLVVAVSLLMGAAVLVGSLTAGHVVVFVVVVALWCFAAGMLWSLSADAGLVAAAASALLITAPPVGVSFGDAATSTALAISGGLAQAVLIALWPGQRWRAQRDALTVGYRSVASHARRLAADPDAVLDADPLIQLRESFTLTEHQAQRRPLAYRGWYGLPERVAMTVSALRRPAGANTVAGILVATADVLDAVADRGHSARRDDAERALGRVDTAVAELSGPSAAVGRRLSTQLHEASALHFAGRLPALDHVEELRRPGFSSSARSARDAVREQLNWESPILRHAIRLAAATAAGTAVARVTGVEHSDWIALTVLMVLRPETAHTYSRCAARVMGNIVGITIATTVTVTWHPTGLASAILAVAFLGVAYAVSDFGYAPLSAALAAAIVFLIDTTGVADGTTVSERLIATLIGGGLAVTAHLLLPDGSLVRLRQRAGEFLKAQIDYAATVVSAFVHQIDDPAEAIRAAWHRAVRARSAFEAAAGTARADSPGIRKWLTSYRAALNAVTGACAVLEAHLPPDSLVTAGRQFTAAVDDYVEALRGDPPSAGRPWRIDTGHLSAANQRLREAAALLTRQDAAARVLVAEVGTINRHLLEFTMDAPAPSEKWPRDDQR